MNYNELSQKIYAQNKAVGWWDDPDRCLYECLQLVSTEVAEATEAERKDLADNHLPHRKGGEVELGDALIRVLDLGGHLGLEYPGVGAVRDVNTVGWSVGRRHFYINERLTDFAMAIHTTRSNVRDAYYGRVIDAIVHVAVSLGHFDLDGAVHEKLEYNRQRADHKREERAKAHGKRF